MTDTYTRNAQRFYRQYRGLSFDEVHGHWRQHLPEQAGFALDVGAGSGRDSEALAALGWDVLAVEPSSGLRSLGKQATQGQAVQWLDDSMPDLKQVRTLSYRFNLILASAVWMHLSPMAQERAFRILTELLAPGGMLVITLRHGPSHDDRTFYPVNREILEGWARNRALITLQAGQNSDKLQRQAVWWDTLVFLLPDDGTGALPVLRHVIVNDDKSSTYKLGLLRTITRVADAVPGMVLKRTDEWVDLPLGVVGLYWIKLYQPLLLRHCLRQAPGTKGYGFAKGPFQALANVSSLDLRVGQSLSGELAATVLRAIRDAVQVITRMPAHFITWPGTQRPVFDSQPERITIKAGPVVLDREVLTRFGTFRVPSLLWDCFSRYACWLEPAIVNEWVQLMRDYNSNYDIGTLYQALNWQEGKRDTSRIRVLVNRRLQERLPVHCVWTQTSLARSQYDIDHCLPWSRWNNNDLWNLLPATRRANSAKSEKLPAAELMHHARPYILEWWEAAFIGKAQQRQFFAEAEAALPLVQEDSEVEQVFDGLMQQRLRLKVNQQLVEWLG